MGQHNRGGGKKKTKPEPPPEAYIISRLTHINLNDKLEYNRSTIPFPDDRPPTEEETKAETNVKAKINKLRTEYLRQKAESKPKLTPTPKKKSKQKPTPNPNPEPLNWNIDGNVYPALNLIEMKHMQNEDWFALKGDNMDYEWMQLCS